MCLIPVWHSCSTVSADEFMKHLQGERKWIEILIRALYIWLGEDIRESCIYIAYYITYVVFLYDYNRYW